MVFTNEIWEAASSGDIAVIKKWWFSPGTRALDVTTLGPRGNALLLCSAYYNRPAIMRFLLMNGADGNLPRINDKTPLHIAAYMGSVDCALLLLEHGADVDPRDDCGSTPLLHATDQGHYEVMCLLLSHGADPGARNELGINAEDEANQDIEDDDYDSDEEAEEAQTRIAKASVLFADVRRAGGWAKYVRYPRFRLLMLRILAEQGRAETKDALLVRLFPAGPPAPEGTKRPRVAYRAQKGGRLPRGIFMHIVGYWRSSRDYLGPSPA